MQSTYMHMAFKQGSPADQPDGEFLASYDAGQFDRLSVAVDAVIMTVTAAGLHCLLTCREEPPQRGRWALPGGFVRLAESLDTAVERVLAAKAGLRGAYTEQLYTFGQPDRDPRTRVLSVSYLALVDPAALAGPAATDDPASLAQISVPWRGEQGGPVIAHGPDGAELPLAFDHARIIGLAVQRLRGKLGYAPVGYELLPPSFTLRQLQQIHEAILGHPLNKDSFRRRLLAGGQLQPTGEREAGVAYRPAELYRFTAAFGAADREEP
jgi:8-oxo-dGTP diphosphatase